MVLFACADWLVRDRFASSFKLNLIFNQYSLYCVTFKHSSLPLSVKVVDIYLGACGSINIHDYSPPLKWIIVNYFGFSIFITSLEIQRYEATKFLERKNEAKKVSC